MLTFAAQSLFRICTFVQQSLSCTSAGDLRGWLWTTGDDEICRTPRKFNIWKVKLTTFHVSTSVCVNLSHANQDFCCAITGRIKVECEYLLTISGFPHFFLICLENLCRTCLVDLEWTEVLYSQSPDCKIYVTQTFVFL